MGLARTIRTTLETRLDSLTGLPLGKERANTDYTPKTGTPWRRETYQPGERVLESLPSSKARVGFDGSYLVDLFYPLNGGADAAEVAAETILASFPLDLGLTLGSGLVLRIRGARTWQGRRDDLWWFQPVELRFEITGLVNAVL